MGESFFTGEAKQSAETTQPIRGVRLPEKKKLPTVEELFQQSKEKNADRKPEAPVEEIKAPVAEPKIPVPSTIEKGKELIAHLKRGVASRFLHKPALRPPANLSNEKAIYSELKKSLTHPETTVEDRLEFYANAQGESDSYKKSGDRFKADLPKESGFFGVFQKELTSEERDQLFAARRALNEGQVAEVRKAQEDILLNVRKHADTIDPKEDKSVNQAVIPEDMVPIPKLAESIPTEGLNTPKEVKKPGTLSRMWNWLNEEPAPKKKLKPTSLNIVEDSDPGTTQLVRVDSAEVLPDDKVTPQVEIATATEESLVESKEVSVPVVLEEAITPEPVVNQPEEGVPEVKTPVTYEEPKIEAPSPELEKTPEQPTVAPEAVKVIETPRSVEKEIKATQERVIEVGLKTPPEDKKRWSLLEKIFGGTKKVKVEQEAQINNAKTIAEKEIETNKVLLFDAIRALPPAEFEVKRKAALQKRIETLEGKMYYLLSKDRETTPKYDPMFNDEVDYHYEEENPQEYVEKYIKPQILALKEALNPANKRNR